MVMRILAGILGTLFLVLTLVTIVQGEFQSKLLMSFVIGPAFLLYAWRGQKGLEKYFPRLAESSRTKKPKDDEAGAG